MSGPHLVLRRQRNLFLSEDLYIIFWYHISGFYSTLCSQTVYMFNDVPVQSVIISKSFYKPSSV